MELSYQHVYAMNKEQARRQLVQTYEQTGSIAQTARLWPTSRQVVRTWVGRFHAEGAAGLADRSRQPHCCPQRTPTTLEEKIVRLLQVDAPLVLGDPTEIPRPQARKAEYVGTLNDGKTKGFCLLTLATPWRGRARPFDFLSYSSKTIQHDLDSRNLNPFRAFARIKALVGEKPLVLYQLRVVDGRIFDSQALIP